MNSSHEVVGLTGAGGRESVLAEKYAQSNDVGRIIGVPGHDLMGRRLLKPFERVGMALKLKAENALQIARVLTEAGVTIADVCQDDAVAGGVVDALRERKIAAVGPTKDAGRLEWSKAFSRKFGEGIGLPQPAYTVFASQREAIDFVRRTPHKKWVTKADGLAAGKGAIVTDCVEEAITAIQSMATFGDAGKIFLVEERLDNGEEFSAFALSDGKDFVLAGTAQDHKRLEDGDKGPNTGGMGCVSSPFVVTADILRQVQNIFDKTFGAMRLQGSPYTGVLYLGGMVVNGRVNVIEFNSRWGDPEAQVIVPGIKNDMMEIARAITEGNIRKLKLEFDNRVRVAVTLASKGYPGDSEAVGQPITGIEDAESDPDVTFYGAGIALKDGQPVASGGRLGYVMAQGKDVNEAADKAYAGMRKIRVGEDGGYGVYRKDIGYRDITRLKKC